MSLYESLKDIAKVVQQADNIELYLQLIDLSKQALDLQAEVFQLHEENVQLKKRKELEKVVVRHEEPIVTRGDDTVRLYYCAHCWDNDGRLFQVNCSKDGTFTCPHCNMTGVYDCKRKDAYEAEILQYPIAF